MSSFIEEVVIRNFHTHTHTGIAVAIVHLVIGCMKSYVLRTIPPSGMLGVNVFVVIIKNPPILSTAALVKTISDMNSVNILCQ